MRFFVLGFASLFFIKSVFAQADNVGSGRAVLLDGIDDYVDYGDVYNDVNLPFTISAWVYLDPASGVNPIFCTNDNPIVYRGFIFFITPTSFGCEFGDGTGGNNPAFRRGKIALVNNVLSKWIHVCVVMKAPFEIDLYINGINVGGDSSGGSNLPMASSATGDEAKSGYYISNSSTYRFKGMIDELHLWNRALTRDEVRAGMCKKLKGNEPGLIGDWNFDETTGTTVFDKSPRAINGQLMGNPARVFSAAPIGDDSKYLYTPNWVGSFVSLNDGDDQVKASNIQGNPEGLHVYEVKNQPSQTGGLPNNAISQPYFGAFAASLHTGNTFDAAYLFKGAESCKIYSRLDNSVSSWALLPSPATGIAERSELFKVLGSKIPVDLGPDKVLCNTPSVTLSTGVTDPQATFLWNTGETTPSINVTKSGSYSVVVTGECGTVSDTVAVQLMSSPSPISLGADEVFCNFDPIVLDPLPKSKGFQFLWQDNSTDSVFHATDFGKYWVAAKNDCGIASDTITYTRAYDQIGFVPNVITPNGDGKNDFFKVDDILVGSVSLIVLNRWGNEVFRSNAYKNDWNGGDLSPGVYYVVIKGPCIAESKDWLAIIK